MFSCQGKVWLAERYPPDYCCYHICIIQSHENVSVVFEGDGACNHCCRVEPGLVACAVCSGCVQGCATQLSLMNEADAL
jgi:hypothetical protein